MKILILLGTAEYAVLKDGENVYDKISEVWNMTTTGQIRRGGSVDYHTKEGFTVVCKLLSI
jgi:hypothetical protein